MNPELPSQYAIVVGFFLPVIISVILQRGWSTPTKTYVAFDVVLAASLGTAYFEGKVDKANLLTTFFYVLTATITSFKAFWQPTNIAQNIETVTSAEKDNGAQTTDMERAG